MILGELTTVGEQLYVPLRLYRDDNDVGDLWNGGADLARVTVFTHALIDDNQTVVRDYCRPIWECVCVCVGGYLTKSQKH